MRFKRQLFALVLSVLLPAVLAALLAISYVYQEEQATQEMGLKEAARTFSYLVDNELRSRQEILKTLANAPSLSDGDMEKFYAFAKKSAPTSDTVIILVDKNGRQLFNTRRPLGSELPIRRNSNIGDLMKADGGAGALVSDVFVASIAKRYEFIVQVPIMKEGEIQNFLVMGVNAEVMQALLSKQDFPSKWLGAIVDRQGVLLARSRDADKFVGRKSDDRLQKLFTSTRHGVTRSVTLDGVAVKTFYHRVLASDWTIVLSVPESDLRNSAIRGAGLFGVAVLLLLMFSLLIAKQIGAGVISRMRRLEFAAEALGRGEQVAYSSQGLVEVDAVGNRIAEASRQLHANQRELESRVAQAVSETERAQRALLQGQKMEALGRLTGGIAHEFNNLLQTLATSLQLAKRAKDPERLQELLETCGKALKRAKVLTGQLSSFGRTQDARMETVLLSKQIEEVRQLVDSVLPASVRVDISVAQPVWAVKIDPRQFELAFLNLVINSKDAMPGGGQIRISVTNELDTLPADSLPQGDYVLVSFSDSGIGMTSEIMAKALDPFFTTKSVGEGTGLGLPQAFGFARQSGGTLLLHSREGEGTRVDIYLPRAIEAAPAAQSVQADESKALAAQAGGTVLFVEDDALVRESVGPALESGGFFVIMAESADAALACLEAGTKVNFVFSDVVMPGTLNGIDLARTVVGRFPHIKVVLATGYSENRISMPGVQVLAKPYDISDVLRVLKR